MTKIWAAIFPPFALLAVIVMSVAALSIACRGSQGELSKVSDVPKPSIELTSITAIPGRLVVSDSEVLFGQSTAISGPAAELGMEIRRRIQPVADEQNNAGGFLRLALKLTTVVDSSEQDSAYSNTWNLIRKQEGFAPIGEMGSPTYRAASPLVSADGVPSMAPFTAAEFLQDSVRSNLTSPRVYNYQEAPELTSVKWCHCQAMAAFQ